MSGIAMAVILFSLRISTFQGKYSTLILLFCYNIFSALTDVAVNAIMVTLARLDPRHGPSDMQTLHVVSICIGGICGSLVASVANTLMHPYNVLAMYSFILALISILAFCVRDIPIEEHIGACENIKISLKHMTNRVVFGTLVFMFISRAIVPSYQDIMYYFFINVLNFTKSVIALLSLIAFTTAIFGSFLYNLCLKNLEFKVTMLIAHLIIGVAIMSTYLLVSRISYEVLGVNDIVFAFFTDAALDVLFVAFIFMPMLVVQTKIVPKNVEATVYSVFGSLRNLANDTVSPLMGGIIANNLGVTRDNFDNISQFLFKIINFRLNCCYSVFYEFHPNFFHLDIAQ